MLHHKLAFKLLIELERYGYDYEKSRCRKSVYERRVVKHEREYYGRHYCDYREEDRAEQSKSLTYASKMFRRRSARTYTGNKSAVLLNVSRNVLGIELYLRVEVREEKYQKSRKNKVYRSTGSEPGHPPTVETAVGRYDRRDELRKRDYRRSEYDGKHACRVDLYGDIRALTAVLLSSFNLLGVGYGHASFGRVDEYDKSEYYDDKRKETYKLPYCRISRRNSYYRSEYALTCRRKYTDEDEKRNTVADTVIGYSFAEPHREHRTRYKHNGYEYRDEPQRKSNSENLGRYTAVTRRTYDDTRRLSDREHKSHNARYVCNLTSAVVALLAPFLEFGNGYRQELNYNRRIDVRRYADREKRTVCKRAARDCGQKSEESIGLLLAAVPTRRNAGKGQPTAQPINNQKSDRYEDLRPDLLVFKRVYECAKHQSTSALPPSFSSFSTADLENFAACTVSFFVSAPSPRTLRP